MGAKKKFDIRGCKPSPGATKSRHVFDIVNCGENLHQIYLISELIMLILLYTDKVRGYIIILGKLLCGYSFHPTDLNRLFSCNVEVS